MPKDKNEKQSRPSTVDTPSQNDTPEVIPDYSQPTTSLALRPSQLKRLRPLTLDATSISRLTQVICVTLGELCVQDMPAFGSKNNLAPTVTVDIQDCVSGDCWCLICNAVLASALKRAGAPLAGRYFAIQAGEIVAGKRYRKVDVVELERAE